MKISRLLAVPLCCALLILTTAGFSCSPDQKSSRERNVVTGLTIAANAVEPGINTMRALREAGLVEPATSLLLAKGALTVNAAFKRVTEAALAGADSHTLAEQLNTAVNLARDLQADGTLHLKNGKTKLIFELGVTTAQSGLVIALSQLKDGGGAPVPFSLDESTKARLRDLLPVFDKNDGLLRDAVTRLATP
jgi:hypothetical protein